MALTPKRKMTDKSFDFTPDGNVMFLTLGTNPLQGWNLGMGGELSGRVALALWPDAANPLSLRKISWLAKTWGISMAVPKSQMTENNEVVKENCRLSIENKSNGKMKV